MTKWNRYRARAREIIESGITVERPGRGGTEHG